MYFNKTQIFHSFGVLGCLIDQLLTEKHLILYDRNSIRIYEILQNMTLNLIDSISLTTNIQQIALIHSERALILNDLNQLSAISLKYPYEHRLLTMPPHFQNCTMQCSQNRLQVYIRSGAQVCIYELNHRQEFTHNIVDLQESKEIQEVVQIETTPNGEMYVLMHSYEAHNEYNNFINHKTGFTTSVGMVKSTIQKKQKHFQSSITLKFAVIQILPLEQDQILYLTNRMLYLNRAEKQEFQIFFPKELPVGVFMRYVPVRCQVLVCYQPNIEIIQLQVDYFGQIVRMDSVAVVNCAPGIIDMVVTWVQDENKVLVWMQTDAGASYLSYLQERRQQVNLEIEPATEKKVKIESEYAFKIITHFQTYKRIFNFTVLGNTLIMLSGNQYRQQITKVQHEIQLIMQNTISVEMIVFYDGLALQQVSDSLKLFRLNSDLQPVQFESLYNVQAIHNIILNGIINQNSYFILTQSQIHMIQLHPLTLTTHQVQINQPIHLDKFIIGKNQDGYLVLIDLTDGIRQFRISDICEDNRIINVDHYDLVYVNSQLNIIMEGNDQLQIVHLNQDNQLITNFITQQYLRNINAIIHLNEQDQSLIASTCPSVHLSLQEQINTEDEHVHEIKLISIKQQLILLIIYQDGRMSMYKKLDTKTFKLLSTFQLPITLLQRSRTYYSQNIILPEYNLVLTEQLGEILVNYLERKHLIFKSVHSIAKQTYLLDQSNQLHSLQIQQALYPANQVLAYPLFNDNKKQIVMISSFHFSGQDYLLVVNRIKLQRQLKNEIQIFKHDNLITPFIEFSEIENEEVIKVQYMPVYELIIVLCSCYAIPPAMESTRVHILKIDGFNKLIELEYKSIKDSVPVDLTILTPFQMILVATQDQLKFFDPPNKTRNSTLLALSLQVNDAQKIGISSYEAVISLDRWIAALNGGFKVIVCRLSDELTQPKPEQVIEFGCSNEKILDLQLFRLQGKSAVSILSSTGNLHIYSLIFEKNKIKKIADCYIPEVCKISTISDSHSDKLLISTNDGHVYLIDEEQAEKKRDQVMLTELPFIGGFNPINQIYARGKRVGNVNHSQANEIRSSLSFALQKALG